MGAYEIATAALKQSIEARKIAIENMTTKYGVAARDSHTVFLAAKKSIEGDGGQATLTEQTSKTFIERRLHFTLNAKKYFPYEHPMSQVAVTLTIFDTGSVKIHVEISNGPSKGEYDHPDVPQAENMTQSNLEPILGKIIEKNFENALSMQDAPQRG